MVQLKTSAACLKSRSDPLGTMVVVPQFRGNEYVLPPDLAFLENFLNSIPDHFLISVSFCTIDVPKSYFQRVNDRLCCDRGIFARERCAESDGRHLTSSVYKGEFCIAKCIVCHTFPPLSAGASLSRK